MWMVKYIILATAATSFGIATAGGYFALISLIGIVPRLASTSKTAKHILSYENVMAYGALCGALLYVYPFRFHTGWIFPATASFFGGVFIGCLAGALAEIVNVLPILARRADIRKGLPYAIYALALGKGAGVFVQFLLAK